MLTNRLTAADCSLLLNIESSDMSIYQAHSRIAASLLYLEAWTKLGSGEPINDTLLFIGDEYTALRAIADQYPETALLAESAIFGWREYAAEFRPYLH